MLCINPANAVAQAQETQPETPEVSDAESQPVSTDATGV